MCNFNCSWLKLGFLDSLAISMCFAITMRINPQSSVDAWVWPIIYLFHFIRPDSLNFCYIIICNCIFALCGIQYNLFCDAFSIASQHSNFCARQLITKPQQHLFSADRSHLMHMLYDTHAVRESIMCLTWTSFYALLFPFIVLRIKRHSSFFCYIFLTSLHKLHLPVF